MAINKVAVLFCLLIVVSPSLIFPNALATHRATPVISVSCYMFWGWWGAPVYRCDPYTTSGDIRGLEVGDCDDEIVVYVHGYWESRESAIDKFNLARKSLQSNGYTGPIIGFSWPSMTLSWFAVESWNRAKIYAELSGERLGQFINDFDAACQNTEIRLIGHSLGARLILSSLEYLNNNHPALRLTSVHVLGAAVDDGIISTGSNFGIAIQNQTDEFHNKFSPEDDILEEVYFDSDLALGENGGDNNVPWPSTYDEEDVLDELIRDSDGDGRDDVGKNCGDNHNGYIGVEDARGSLIDDGAIDEIVSDWTGRTDIVAFSDCM
jgi:pimeloyl-ACP methyl ester carboxylesterase